MQAAGDAGRGTRTGPIADWGVGRYEAVAADLLPAARVVVESAVIRDGDRVVDLGCGTGNAALLAAAHSDDVVGVDPAARLLDVARARAARERKRIRFRQGDAASLPLDDSSVDVLLSVFGVIFAPDPTAAAAEMSRVLAPGGRMVLSAWIPAGTIFETNTLARATIRQATGVPAPKSFAWHDHRALAELFGPYGFQVDVHQHDLAFTANSAREFLDDQARNHPMAVAGYSVLERLGRADELRSRLLEILEDGNEDSDGFRTTSRYVVASAYRR